MAAISQGTVANVGSNTDVVAELKKLVEINQQTLAMLTVLSHLTAAMLAEHGIEIESTVSSIAIPE